MSGLAAGQGWNVLGIGSESEGRTPGTSTRAVQVDVCCTADLFPMSPCHSARQCVMPATGRRTDKGVWEGPSPPRRASNTRRGTPYDLRRHSRGHRSESWPYIELGVRRMTGGGTVSHRSGSRPYVELGIRGMTGGGTATRRERAPSALCSILSKCNEANPASVY